jgi:hypothetical protein
MEVNIHDKEYNEYINQLNDYIVSTDGIFKKITDDINNIIDIKYDKELNEMIQLLNKLRNKQQLIDKYIKENNITMKIDKIKLDNYRTESDKILISSYGDDGFKLTITYKDYTIYEESLCMDDFQYTKKEDILPQIQNKFKILQENYSFLCVYLYFKIIKSTTIHSEIKEILDITNSSKLKDSKIFGQPKPIEPSYKLNQNVFNSPIPQTAGSNYY